MGVAEAVGAGGFEGAIEVAQGTGGNYSGISVKGFDFGSGSVGLLVLFVLWNTRKVLQPCMSEPFKPPRLRQQHPPQTGGHLSFAYHSGKGGYRYSRVAQFAHQDVCALGKGALE